MKIARYECDVCKAVKGEANHWWIRLAQAGSDAFMLIPWNEDEADMGTCQERVLQHLCGEGCVGKALSSWMQGVSSQEARRLQEAAR